MNLSERLGMMSPEARVKIGTRLGSGWFNAGKVKGLNEETAAVIDADLKRSADSKLKEASGRLRKYAARFPEITDTLESEKKVRKYGINIKNSSERLAEMVRDSFLQKPILEREIVEEFPALGENAVNIILEGNGSGREFIEDRGSRPRKKARSGEVLKETKQEWDYTTAWLRERLAHA